MAANAFRELVPRHQHCAAFAQARIDSSDAGRRPLIDSGVKDRLFSEVEIAARDSAFQKGVMELGAPTAFTCPECHGVLVRIKEQGLALSRFRCHTGHAYTDNALLEGVMESVGEMLWQVIRSFEESVMLLNQMGQFLEDAGDTDRAQHFYGKARQLEEQSTTSHQDILRHESLSGDNLGQVADDK